MTAKILWMGQTVKEAVDSARIHHQLFPPKLFYEYGLPKQVVDGLKSLGHAVERYRVRGSVACVVLYENSTIFANADYRKGGDVYGIDWFTCVNHLVDPAIMLWHKPSAKNNRLCSSSVEPFSCDYHNNDVRDRSRYHYRWIIHVWEIDTSILLFNTTFTPSRSPIASYPCIALPSDDIRVILNLL